LSIRKSHETEPPEYKLSGMFFIQIPEYFF
jgi:hypothetical protein